MILVTVGTHTQGFERLVRPMDALAAALDERVVIQRGSSSYTPRHAEHFRWTTSEHMEELTAEARVVVAHAAAGAIILALREKKPLVVAPRLARYGEHFDDHQLQLATMLDAQSKALVVYEPSLDTLRAAIQRVAIRNPPDHVGPTQLVHALQQQLNQWCTTTAPSTIY
ncbi:MAG: beta-1,4-galactosyltransferase [Chloroflexota bacterium]|nr:beta-1,4-galactosyltransferase [Chloroflexota bacterium]